MVPQVELFLFVFGRFEDPQKTSRNLLTFDLRFNCGVCIAKNKDDFIFIIYLCTYDG